MLGDQCPTNVDTEIDFEGEYWEEAFRQLQFPILHLTFYPKIHFADAVKRFKPELPFKLRVPAQIVRTQYIRLASAKYYNMVCSFVMNRREFRCIKPTVMTGVIAATYATMSTLKKPTAN